MSPTFEANNQVACVRNLIKLKNKTKFSFHYKDPNHKGSQGALFLWLVVGDEVEDIYTHTLLSPPFLM